MSSLIVPVLSRIPNLITELSRALPNVSFYEVKCPETDSQFKNSAILICDFDLLGPHLYSLPNAQWIQGTWAGVNTLMPHVREALPFPVTRFTGRHFGKLMGEYVIANIVNLERNFFKIRENQKNQTWLREGNYRAIFDLNIGILGLGNIGSRIGQTLNFLGARIMAMGRKPSLPNIEEYSYVHKYYTKDTLLDLLKNCDYVVNVLPSTPETKGMLDNDILEHCKVKKSVLINIGRGDVISEANLIKALEKQWLSAAVLDVFPEEPLPTNSPLWKKNEVFITPHMAGDSRAKDVAEIFKENLDLYYKQLPLPAVIDFSKGY